MSPHSLTRVAESEPVRGAYAELGDLIGLARVAQEMRSAKQGVARSMLAGDWRSRHRGRGMDFEEVRLYLPGDDVRTIDWRVTARSSQPHTKIFVEERERPVLIALDQRAPLFFGSRTCFKSVLGAHTAALLAWLALANRDRVGGLVMGNHRHQEIRPRRSKASVLALIRQIHDCNRKLESPLRPSGMLSLKQLLELCLRLAHPGTTLDVISDFGDLDAEAENLLVRLVRQVQLRLFQITDPLESNWPALEGLWVTDGTRRAQLQGDARRPAAMSTPLDQQRQRLARLSRHHGFPFIHLTTAEPLLEQLRAALQPMPRRR